MEQKEQSIVFDVKLMTEVEFNTLVEMLETMLSLFQDKQNEPP